MCHHATECGVTHLRCFQACTSDIVTLRCYLFCWCCMWSYLAFLEFCLGVISFTIIGVKKLLWTENSSLPCV